MGAQEGWKMGPGPDWEKDLGKSRRDLVCCPGSVGSLGVSQGRLLWNSLECWSKARAQGFCRITWGWHVAGSLEQFAGHR